MQAFALAINKSVPIEFDVHILKDGNIVVYHDDDLERLMDINRSVSSYDYDELQKLTFPNTDIKIPLFDDVLSFIDGKVMIVIEIKRTKIISYKKYCERIVSILKNYPYDFVIKSFDIRIVNWFLHNTNYITGLLITKRKMSFYDWLMNRNVTISVLKPNFISVDYRIISNAMVKKFRKIGPVLVWTIRDIDTLNCIKDEADSYLIEKFYF